MQDILLNQSSSIFFLLHLLVQWKLLDAKFRALGAVTVPDLCRLYRVDTFFWSGLQQLYLLINTKATGTLAVHFKLLFQNQWSEAETWDLSHQHPRDSWFFPVPGVSPQVLLTALSAGPCSHFTGTQLDHEKQPAGQYPLPIPWQLVPLQCFMESSSPQGCGTEGRGPEVRIPGADRGSG